MYEIAEYLNSKFRMPTVFSALVNLHNDNDLLDLLYTVQCTVLIDTLEEKEKNTTST